MTIDHLPDEAITHAGKFHADDVFSAALLRLLRPGIRIRRVLRIPDGYSGLAFDIGWGPFDHIQKGAPCGSTARRMRPSAAVARPRRLPARGGRGEAF